MNPTVSKFELRLLALFGVLVAGASCHSHGERPPRVAAQKGAGLAQPSAQPVAAPVATSASESERRWFDAPVYFDALVARAMTLSQSPPASAARELPAEIADLTYDQYRSIRFRPDRGLWRESPGEIEAQFFHVGFGFKDPVKVWVLDNPDAVTPVPFKFSSELFSYADVRPPVSEKDLGFAGVRLHMAWNTPEYLDEFIVFQGASYFRTLGKGQAYGLSCRGLAVDMGESRPEEFPRFSELYLVKPAPGERFARLLALLESERVTGAYSFHITAGDPTVVQVTARVFFREPVDVLGLAPLTSMYLFGEEQPSRFGHFRPEVHDSDLLLQHGSNGEWLARPLRNPPRTTVSSFRLDSPRGFGLLQRDRRFSNYEDLEARYQDRPSAWVEPVGDWGPGALRLLEIATEKETDDNVAVAWIPDQVPPDGLLLTYRLRVGELALETLAGQVMATRIETADMPEAPKHGAWRFVVDFALSPERVGAEGPVLDVSAQGGQVLEKHAQKNPYANGYRVSFLVAADTDRKEVELRALLRDATGGALTPTWSYLWQPS